MFSILPSGWTTVWASPTTSFSCFSSLTPCSTASSSQQRSFSTSSNSGWWASLVLNYHSCSAFDIGVIWRVRVAVTVSAVATPRQWRTKASVVSYTFLKSTVFLKFLVLLFLSLPGGFAKWARKVSCPFSHVCGAHVLRQSHVPLWLPLLVGGQKQIHSRWGFTYLSENTLRSAHWAALSRPKWLINYLLGRTLVLWMQALCKGLKHEGIFWPTVVFPLSRGLLGSCFCQWTRQKWLQCRYTQKLAAGIWRESETVVHPCLHKVSKIISWFLFFQWCTSCTKPGFN